MLQFFTTIISICNRPGRSKRGRSCSEVAAGAVVAATAPSAIDEKLRGAAYYLGRSDADRNLPVINNIARVGNPPVGRVQHGGQQFGADWATKYTPDNVPAPVPPAVVRDLTDGKFAVA